MSKFSVIYCNFNSNSEIVEQFEDFNSASAFKNYLLNSGQVDDERLLEIQEDQCTE